MNLILMFTIPKSMTQNRPDTPKKSTAAAIKNSLHHQAFDNSLQANIITTASSGKIIIVNSAACKLLGYSEKELLTKSRAAIFDIKESSFKKMLKQRTAEGQSKALVTAIKKSGKPFPCEITSAVFMDENGIEKAITTIADMTLSILKQKNIDTKKEKIVADNIVLAQSNQKKIDIKNEKGLAHIIVIAQSNQKKSNTKKRKITGDNNIAPDQLKQKQIDIQKEKIVADNIALAKSEQKAIDIEKEKIVGDNIILAKSKQKAIDIQKEKIVANDIAQAKSEQKKIDTKKEKIVADNIILAKSKQKAIDIQKEKIVANDIAQAKSEQKEIDTKKEKIVAENIILAQAKSDARLAENSEEQSEKFFLAAKLSFDVIWDWNLLTNELFMGEGYEALFGYTLKNNKGNITDWGNHLHPDDKEAVEQGLHEVIASSATHWEHAYRFIRADGSIARVFDRASIIRHAGGKAYRMIGAMQDVSRQKELEEKLDYEIADKGKLLAAYKESFKLIFNSSSDVLFDVDLAADEVLISDAYEKEFGYKITNNMTPAKDWISHIHPDDKEAVIKDYLRVLASDETEWKYSYRFLRADNSVANVLSNRIILRNANGKAYRMMGSMHDISKQKVLEERLEQEIKLKEKQIAEAMRDAKDTERSDIGRELHDNITQLLGVSKLYLDMAKSGGDNSEMYLSRSSEYTLSAIEEIRKLTKGLTNDIIKNLGLCEAINNIVRDTMEVNPVKISCELESFIEDSVNDKFKLNVYRIIQEQLNNILKHAKAKGITISLSQNKKSIILAISDNGVGFDTRKKRKGIGVDNIKSRAVSYDGYADIVSQPGQGCVLTATFPVADALVKKS